VTPDPAPAVVCPPVRAWSKSFQKQIAAEMRAAPNSALEGRGSGNRAGVRLNQERRAMTTLTDEDVKAIVSQTVTALLAEQKRLHEDSIDHVVLRTLTTILTSFGMEEKDRKELRADLAHVAKWSKSVEQAQGLTLKVVLTMIVTGFCGASGSVSKPFSANSFRASLRTWRSHLAAATRARRSA
jgi:hypothetical protein